VMKIVMLVGLSFKAQTTEVTGRAISLEEAKGQLGNVNRVSIHRLKFRCGRGVAFQFAFDRICGGQVGWAISKPAGVAPLYSDSDNLESENRRIAFAAGHPPSCAAPWPMDAFSWRSSSTPFQ
jgi:hypothetical protein